MRVIVLGSAQDGGLPQLGAAGRLDSQARKGSLPERTASSVAVVEGGRTLLLDASPDLRRQESMLRLLTGRTGPGPAFDGIVLTHAHMGHYAGLLQLGREAAATGRMRCWVTPSMARFLAGHQPWASLVDLGHIDLLPVDPSRPFTPWPGLTARLVAVPHRAEHTDTVAVSIDERFLYLPDIDGWHLWPPAHREVGRHGTALLDATFWRDDELEGRSPSEFPHPLAPDTMRMFGDAATAVVLGHLNHTNPLCDPDGPESAEADRAGFTVAYDGMVLEL